MKQVQWLSFHFIIQYFTMQISIKYCEVFVVNVELLGTIKINATICYRKLFYLGFQMACKICSFFILLLEFGGALADLDEKMCPYLSLNFIKIYLNLL